MTDPIRQYGNNGTQVGGITVDTPYEDNKAGVQVEDFLQLMIAQLTNQDFMNPVDDTQYVTQLAQFATMQAMQELSHYSQTNYVTGLIGKTVTVASLGLGGSVNRETGIVSKITLSGDEYLITVNGKDYKLNQIMQVHSDNIPVSVDELENAKNIMVRTNSVGQNSISLAWEPPTSDEAKKAGLTYDVYYSTDPGLNFNAISDVKQGTAAATGLKNPEYILTGLQPGTTYYINVVVRNQNGDEQIYQSTTQVTTDS